MVSNVLALVSITLRVPRVPQPLLLSLRKAQEPPGKTRNQGFRDGSLEAWGEPFYSLLPLAERGPPDQTGLPGTAGRLEKESSILCS
jgi:hypothetical protein